MIYSKTACRLCCLFVTLSISLALLPIPAFSADASAFSGEIGDRTEFPAPRPPRVSIPRYFGAITTTNSPGWAEVIDRAESAGLLVLAVVPGSAAAFAGILPGDVIVAIDQHQVRNEESAVVLLRSGRPKYRINLVRADGKRETVQAELTTVEGFSTQAFLQSNFEVRRDPISQYLVAKGESDPRVALELVDQLIRDTPNFADAHALRATLLLKSARLSQRGHIPTEEAAIAEAEIAQAKRLDPGSPDILRRSARSLLDLQEPAQAQQEAAEAITLDDSSAEAHHLLGLSLLMLGRPKAALPHLHRAVSLNQYGARYYTALADCYSRVGQERRAEKTRQVLEKLTSLSGERDESLRQKALRVGTAAFGFLFLGATIAGMTQRRSPRETEKPKKDSEGHPQTKELTLAESLAGLGLWSLVVPALGPVFGLVPNAPGTNIKVDLVEHIVPGLVVLVASMGLILALVHALEGQTDILTKWAGFTYLAPGIIFLAGLWMTMTHIQVIDRALKGTAPWSTTVVHSIAGPSLMVLSALLHHRLTRLLPPPEDDGNARTGNSLNQPVQG